MSLPVCHTAENDDQSSIRLEQPPPQDPRADVPGTQAPSEGQEEGVESKTGNNSAVSPQESRMKLVVQNVMDMNHGAAKLKPSLLAGALQDDGASNPPVTCGTPSNQVVSGLTQVHPTIQPSVFHDAKVSSTDTCAKASLSTKRAVTGHFEHGSSKSPSPKGVKANTGRWTEAEHKLFLKGLETFPYRAWKKIATLIKTRTVVQIRTHAQKYYQKLEKEEARMREREQQLVKQQEMTKHRPVEPDATSLSDASSTAARSDAGSMTRKKPAARKRKACDQDLSPDFNPTKRMSREKRCLRAERSLSPKEKTNASIPKFSFSMSEVLGNGDGVESLSSRSIHIPRPTSLEFDDVAHSSSMSTILDFTDDKSVSDFPLPMDGSLEQCVAFDSDEFLQLTDEESLDWFSNDKDDTSEIVSLSKAVPSTPASPVSLGSTKQQFSPLSTSDAALALESSDLTNNGITEDCGDLMFATDDDDDFVLDPEKFLSSYLSPSS